MGNQKVNRRRTDNTMDKRTYNDLQNITHKTKELDPVTQPH